MRRVAPCLILPFLFVARPARPQGMPLGPEFRANTFTTGNQARASVASDPSGAFVVVWSSYLQDGSSDGVFAQRFDGSGAPVGPEFRVNAFTTDDQGYPAVAGDATGNFVVTWDSLLQDGSAHGIFGQRYAGSGTPLGPEFRANSFTTSEQRHASVGVDAAGNFVVVWSSYSQDGSGYGVFAQRFLGSGTPLGPEFRVNTSTAGSQLGASVASDPSGNFVVAWMSYDGSGYGVFAQRYSGSGAPLGPEFRVNTLTAYLQAAPSVACDASGNFVVVWQSPDADGEGISGQRFAGSGAPLGPEFRVNTFTTGGQRYPSAAADASGNFVVAWQGNAQDGAAEGVFGQRYTGAGAPSGPEFRVNTYTTSYQARPRVAVDLSGDFVVVWESYTEDASAFGVFGQRYGQIVPVELMRFGVE